MTAERLRTRSFAGSDLFLACVGASVAVYIVVTTLVIVHNAYSPLPYGDAWTFWRQQVLYGNFTNYLFNQHNEHRIAVPRLFFLIDRLAFHGRDVFPIVCSLLAQAATGVWLYKMARRGVDFSRASLVLLGSAICSALFSAQQFPNLVEGFQIATTMLYCGACGSVLALVRAAESGEEGVRRELWFAASCVSALVATYSSANGLLCFPILLLLALWFRLPRRFPLALIVNAVLVSAVYMRGYYTPPRHSAPLAELTHHFTGVFLRAATFLGSPSDAIHGAIAEIFGPSDDPRIAVAAAFGIAGMAAALWSLILVWRHRERYTDGQAALVHVALLGILTAFLVGLGRATFPVTAAMDARYETHALVFWVALAAFYWARVQRHLTTWTTARGRIAVGGIILCSILTLAFRQPFWVKYSKYSKEVQGEIEAALVADVYDPLVWQRSFPPAGPAIFGAVDYLRQNRLAVFAEAWTAWPGQPVNRFFRVDGASVCLGSFDMATAVISRVRPGWLVAGWAWDKLRQSGPETVILVDAAQRIAGVARNTFERPDVRQVIAEVRLSRVGWRGYVAGSEPKALTAYLLERDGHSLCALGGALTLPRAAGGQAAP